MDGGLLFVGLDNPQSRDPRHALFPHPKGCAGHRLFEMMMEVDKYFDRAQFSAIPKTNLFPCGRMPTKNKKGFKVMAAASLVMSLRRGTRVVLLGNEVRDAIIDVPGHEMDFAKSMQFYEVHGSYYAWVPHPSGRNHYYNDTRRRRKVARFLHEARKVR